MKKILVCALLCAMLVPLAAFSGEPAGEATLKAGDVLTFGLYEQDNDPANGAEGIEWRVLTTEEGKALLLSENNLDWQHFNETSADVTWETSTLRSWLNADFLNAAFTGAEQDAILETDVKNDNNPEYGTEGGNDTSDRIFLLSIAEVETLFTDDSAREARNTPYAVAQGANDFDGFGSWGLRSPGKGPRYVACVGGSIDFAGAYVIGDDTCALRPALWVSLDAGIF